MTSVATIEANDGFEIVVWTIFALSIAATISIPPYVYKRYLGNSDSDTRHRIRHNGVVRKTAWLVFHIVGLLATVGSMSAIIIDGAVNIAVPFCMLIGMTAAGIEIIFEARQLLRLVSGKYHPQTEVQHHRIVVYASVVTLVLKDLYAGALSTYICFLRRQSDTAVFAIVFTSTLVLLFQIGLKCGSIAAYPWRIGDKVMKYLLCAEEPDAVPFQVSDHEAELVLKTRDRMQTEATNALKSPTTRVPAVARAPERCPACLAPLVGRSDPTPDILGSYLDQNARHEGTPEPHTPSFPFKGGPPRVPPTWSAIRESTDWHQDTPSPPTLAGDRRNSAGSAATPHHQTTAVFAQSVFKRRPDRSASGRRKPSDAETAAAAPAAVVEGRNVADAAVGATRRQRAQFVEGTPIPTQGERRDSAADATHGIQAPAPAVTVQSCVALTLHSSGEEIASVAWFIQQVYPRRQQRLERVAESAAAVLYSAGVTQDEMLAVILPFLRGLCDADRVTSAVNECHQRESGDDEAAATAEPTNREPLVEPVRGDVDPSATAASASRPRRGRVGSIYYSVMRGALGTAVPAPPTPTATADTAKTTTTTIVRSNLRGQIVPSASPIFSNPSGGRTVSARTASGSSGKSIPVSVATSSADGAARSGAYERQRVYVFPTSPEVENLVTNRPEDRSLGPWSNDLAPTVNRGLSHEETVS